MNKFEYDYSSGIESDHDVDLLVEQEVMQIMKKNKDQKKKDEEEKQSKDDIPSKEPLSKEEVNKRWEETVGKVPEEFNFIIRTYADE